MLLAKMVPIFLQKIKDKKLTAVSLLKRDNVLNWLQLAKENTDWPKEELNNIKWSGESNIDNATCKKMNKYIN